MQKLRSPFSFLNQSVARQFRSSYSLEESVSRLHAASFGSGVDSWAREAAVGSVTADYVQLQRAKWFIGHPYKPFFNGSYKPVFTGSFSQDEHGVVLSGRFATNRWLRISFKVGSCFFAVATCLSILPALAMPKEKWWMPFAGIIVTAADLGTAKLKHWSTRGDIERLSSFIEQVLAAPGAMSRPAPTRKIGWLRQRFLELAGQ